MRYTYFVLLALCAFAVYALPTDVVPEEDFATTATDSTTAPASAKTMDIRLSQASASGLAHSKATTAKVGQTQKTDKLENTMKTKTTPAKQAALKLDSELVGTGLRRQCPIRKAAENKKAEAKKKKTYEQDIAQTKKTYEQGIAQTKKTYEQDIAQTKKTYEQDGFVGCYPDKNDRAMGEMRGGKFGSIKACNDECVTAGKKYLYFGRQWDGECFCSDSYDKNGCKIQEDEWTNRQNRDTGKNTRCNCDAASGKLSSWANCVYTVDHGNPRYSV